MVMDANSDGVLSREEVHRFEKDIAPSINKTYDAERVDEKFNAMDTDQSGSISLREWVAYCRREAGFDD